MRGIVQQGVEAKKAKKKVKKGQLKVKAATAVKDPASHFLAYDLQTMQLPVEAWPWKDKTYYGKHGYTINSKNGAVPWVQIAIELRARYHVVSL